MAFNAIIPNDPVEVKTAYFPTISLKKELTILLLGSGGREHAITWRLSQDDENHERRAFDDHEPVTSALLPGFRGCCGSGGC